MRKTLNIEAETMYEKNVVKDKLMAMMLYRDFYSSIIRMAPRTFEEYYGFSLDILYDTLLTKLKSKNIKELSAKDFMQKMIKVVREDNLFNNELMRRACNDFEDNIDSSIKDLDYVNEIDKNKLIFREGKTKFNLAKELDKIILRINNTFINYYGYEETEKIRNQIKEKIAKYTDEYMSSNKFSYYLVEEYKEEITRKIKNYLINLHIENKFDFSNYKNKYKKEESDSYNNYEKVFNNIINIYNLSGYDLTEKKSKKELRNDLIDYFGLSRIEYTLTCQKMKVKRRLYEQKM